MKSVQNVAILGASLVKHIQNIHSDKCQFVDLIEIKKTCIKGRHARVAPSVENIY